MKTVYLLGDREYRDLWESAGYSVTYNPQTGYDILCLTGGTDVDPSVYNETVNFMTSPPDVKRDAFEQLAFEAAVAEDKVIVGICRGAQLICALSGGSIYQHIGNAHGSPHTAVPYNGEAMTVTSSHHQMMNPQPLGNNYTVLMCTTNMCNTYQNGDGPVEPPPVDYEVVYFHKTKALGHQPHPEWMKDGAEYKQWFFETVEEMFKPNPFTTQGQ